jgi:hypothetical protein
VEPSSLNLRENEKICTAACTWLPDSRVIPAGLKYIVLASSATAAAPANALPRPLTLFWVIENPAARTVSAADAMQDNITSAKINCFQHPLFI